MRHISCRLPLIKVFIEVCAGLVFPSQGESDCARLS
jgi:hypothetical protein